MFLPLLDHKAVAFADCVIKFLNLCRALSLGVLDLSGDEWPDVTKNEVSQEH